MSDSQNAGFGKFVPGFDFLQSLTKGAAEATPQMPHLVNWIAPTLSVEELEKRISELKTVHFWLEQNSRALAATVQALEVQKMTLATLKGMNFNIGDGTKPKATQPATTAAGLVDPMQLWGSLTQQFQQIAAGAMKEANKNTAMGEAQKAPKKTARKTSGRAP